MFHLTKRQTNKYLKCFKINYYNFYISGKGLLDGLWLRNREQGNFGNIEKNI